MKPRLIETGSVGWMTGFEPATPRTTIWCSNQLSYNHHLYFPELNKTAEFGVTKISKKPAHEK